MVNCLYHACIVVYFSTLSTNKIIIIIITSEFSNKTLGRIPSGLSTLLTFNFFSLLEMSTRSNLILI